MKNKTRRISRMLPAILAVMLCVTVFPVTAIVAFPRTTTGVVFFSTPSALACRVACADGNAAGT